jgi:hypothetical protein
MQRQRSTVQSAEDKLVKTRNMREGRNGGKLKSGNTKNVGRPKLPELHKILADVLGKEGKDGMTAAEEILQALHAKAKKGDTRAAELLLDRAYGKPKQTVDNNITAVEPLVIIKTKEDGNA